MSLDTPAPRGIARSSENRDEVSIGITVRRLVFHFIEDLLKAHDRRGLHIAALTQRAIQQSMRQQPLRRGHFLKGQTLAGLQIGCPSTRQPHVELPGVPKIVTKYRSASRFGDLFSTS